MRLFRRGNSLPACPARLPLCFFFFKGSGAPRVLPFSPTRPSPDRRRIIVVQQHHRQRHLPTLAVVVIAELQSLVVVLAVARLLLAGLLVVVRLVLFVRPQPQRSEEHTSELQSQSNLVCRLLLEKKK